MSRKLQEALCRPDRRILRSSDLIPKKSSPGSSPHFDFDLKEHPFNKGPRVLLGHKKGLCIKRTNGWRNGELGGICLLCHSLFPQAWPSCQVWAPTWTSSSWCDLPPSEHTCSFHPGIPRAQDRRTPDWKLPADRAISYPSSPMMPSNGAPRTVPSSTVGPVLYWLVLPLSHKERSSHLLTLS